MFAFTRDATCTSTFALPVNVATGFSATRIPCKVSSFASSISTYAWFLISNCKAHEIVFMRWQHFHTPTDNGATLGRHVRIPSTPPIRLGALVVATQYDAVHNSLSPIAPYIQYGRS